MPIRKRAPKALKGLDFVLASAAVAWNGGAAGIDTATGTVKPMQTGVTTLVFIGWFSGIVSLDGSLTGDGTVEVHVEFPDLVEMEWYANDSAPNDVGASTVGGEVYFKDDRTVSTLATNRSKAGRVIKYDSSGNRVLVQGGLAVTGPTGAGGVSHSVADRTALKAIGADSRFDGMTVMVRSDHSLWAFVAASTVATDVAEQLVAIPAAGTGRWIRAEKTFTAKCPIGFGLADGAKILTVPAGYMLRKAGQPYWEVTEDFTGGTGSAIAVDTDHTGYDTAGDVLGGATGDVAATLVAGVIPGTIGAKFDTLAEDHAFFLDALESFRYQELTDAFTAGAGFVCIPVHFIKKG